MLIYLLAFIGGVLTILSPCILPVLPFVFARADQPFRRSGLPLLTGMALTFSLVAVAAAFGGHWVVTLNQGGRYVAMIVFLVLGVSLLFPSLAETLTRPLVRAGSRLQGNPSAEGSIGKAFVLGVSTGLLWAPCAGPILGLILTGAAIQGPGARSSFLLLSFALGAATSLGIALFAGNKAFSVMKRSLSFEVWIRRALGVAVIMGVAAIALGWDTNLLTKFSFVNTSKAEAHLIKALDPGGPVVLPVSAAGHRPDPAPVLGDEGPMPELSGAVAWLNSPPLTRNSLRGKVVLIDFWTYSCINCLRALPYVEGWAAKYKNSGLVVIGVHTPEFAFEKERANVEKAVRDLKINYPVAIDSDYKIWQAFNNEYWPAHYFIDGKGRIRYHHFGEGQIRRVRACDSAASQGKWRDVALRGNDQRFRQRCRSRPRPRRRSFARNIYRIPSRRALCFRRTDGPGFTQGLYPAPKALSESVGLGRSLEGGCGKRCVAGDPWKNCVPVSCARSSPRARAYKEWQAGSFHSQA